MHYYIFEGPDGVGKTTLIQNITSQLYASVDGRRLHSYRLPGATALGEKIRDIVKPSDPADTVYIDPYTRQILMAADYSSYCTMLNSLKDTEAILLVDRCNEISSRIYLSADGGEFKALESFYNSLERPTANFLFVLSGDLDSITRRLNTRSVDYFDNKPKEFHKRIFDLYDSLTGTDALGLQQMVKATKLASRIVRIDATKEQEEVASDVLAYILDDLVGNQL